jgi:hypothetical protein
MNWSFITYRVEWCVEIVEVDQYEKEMSTLYVKPFPTKEEAEKHISEITTPDKYVEGRLIWKNAANSYHNCRIRRREVKVKDWTEWR